MYKYVLNYQFCTRSFRLVFIYWDQCKMFNTTLMSINFWHYYFWRLLETLKVWSWFDCVQSVWVYSKIPGNLENESCLKSIDIDLGSTVFYWFEYTQSFLAISKTNLAGNLSISIRNWELYIRFGQWQLRGPSTHESCPHREIRVSPTKQSQI